MDKHIMHLLTSFAILLSYFSFVLGYGSGAAPSACESLVPEHGSTPQVSTNPYKIILPKTSVKGSETLDITLTSTNGNDIFKGFFIQVRTPGGNEAFGEFVNDEPTSGTLSCFGRIKNAITHRSPAEKKSVTVFWIAPNDADREYQVYYSVVGSNMATYWTAIPHPQLIRVTRDATVSTPPSILGTGRTSSELLQKWTEVYEGCGHTKGCFGMPTKCVEKFDPKSSNPEACDIMVTWSRRDGKNSFQLTGRPGGTQNGYIAVGHSNDGRMGEDSVVGCGMDGGKVSVKRYHNIGQRNELHSVESLGIPENSIKTTVVDGNIFCSFDQTNHKIDKIDIDFDKNKYYLLLARAANFKSGEGLPVHLKEDRSPSPKSVHITDNIIMGATSNETAGAWLVKVHGSLMIIAWILCGPTGMLIARYYKQTLTEFMPFGRTFWFFFHISCMGTTALLTIVGVIFMIIRKEGLDLANWHASLGLTVLILIIFEVIMAQFRPMPNTTKRLIFNWTHWGAGITAYILAITCIFLAVGLPLANLKRKEFGSEYLFSWITLSVVVFHILTHIVMSTHTIWSDDKAQSENKFRALRPGPMGPNGVYGEAPGTEFRAIVICLYIFCVTVGVITLIVLVSWTGHEKHEVS